ncbi:MAG: recombinase family protein, partial [Nitrosospira sp.]
MNKAGCVEIYEEKASGKSADRPELVECLRALRAGDMFVVWRLDRPGRSLPDLIHIITDLEKRGVAVELLSKKIDTGSAAGRTGRQTV